MKLSEFHKLCINNKITKLDKYESSLFLNSDYNGNTSAHICTLYENYDLLLDIVKSYPEIIKLVNNDGETFMHILVNNNINIIDKILDIDNNIRVPDGIIHILLDTTNDIKLIKKVANRTNLNLPDIPVLNYYLGINEPIPEIINILIESGANVNSPDKNSMTPLIIATSKKLKTNIIKLLIKKGSNPNYAGNADMYLPLNIATKKGLTDIADILIEETDMMHRDNNFNTPLHNAIINRQKITNETLNKIISKSDVNVPNINGQTGLYMLTKSDLSEHINILKHKELNLFAETKEGMTPASNLNDKDYITLLNGTANSILKDQSEDTIKSLLKCKNYFKLEECRTYIKSNIVLGNDLTEIKLPDTTLTNTTLFNSDIVHNIIYLIQILRKHNNAFIPYQNFIADKCMNDLRNLNELTLYRTENGELLGQILKLYTQDFFEFAPHLILWHGPNLCYSYPDLKYYVNKLMIKNDIRFIIFKLTLIPFPNMTHANIVIYDKIKNQVERFEPYGNTTFLMKDLDKLDNYLIRLFKKTINKNIKYIGPKDYMSNAKFQLISKEIDPEYKKMADPVGFCLAWSYWFVELRLTNPDTEIESLVETALNDIIKNNDNILTYIRNYSKKLDNLKNDFLKEIGIKDKDMYITSYNGSRGDTIFAGITKAFTTLINN